MEISEHFDRDQRAEIEAGLEAGLDVFCYAKESFMAIQMRQIRLGLEEGLPVEVYADPDYDWFQMEEIRKGLEQGVNIQSYAEKSLPYDKMREIRKGLRDGIDLSGFRQLDAKLLRELRKAYVSKLDMMEYIIQGYGAEQLEQIRYALEKKLEIAPYLLREFRGTSIREIARGLESGVEVACYARIEYGWRQMREIRLGLEHQLDINEYANPLYNWRQMREIRLGLEEGLDVGVYRSLMYPSSYMKKFREELLQQTSGGETLVLESTGVSRFVLTLSQDEMEARLQVNETSEKEVSVRDIVAFLQKEGIVNGIQEAEIDRLLEQKLYGQPVLVAKGTPPQKGKNGWYEFFFRTELEKKPRLLSDGSVDYQNVEWFEMVTEGQKLAVYHPAEKGKNGWTVTGKMRKAIRGKEERVLYGRGVRVLEDKRSYLAEFSGKIELQGNRMDITKVCVLEEITLATGNLDFDGSVHIKGNVGSKTRLTATGDIVVDGTVEEAELISGGSVLLKKGINGAGNGSVTAAGNVECVFMESVRITAGEDIRADYCLNCELHAGGSLLISGRKGALTGGNAYAAKGVRTYQLGNKAGLITRLRMGISERARQEKQKLEQRQEENRKETQILRNACMDFETRYSPEQRNAMELYLKLENAIYTKEKQFKALKELEAELKERLEDMQQAKAIISGQVYQGTEVEIDTMKWRAATEISNVSIRKMQNRIAVYAN